MPKIKKYAPGAPNWVDLSTSDEKGALKFYGALFGWKDDPQPMKDGSFYHLEKLKGLTAAAIRRMMPEEKKTGMPSHWNIYFSVNNADETAAKASKLGGKVMAPPMDVMEEGRMAVIQDPQGAMFALWQPRKYAGCEVMMEPGSVNWIELLTTDSTKAAAFYSGLLGVTASRVPDMDYTLLSVGGKDVAGIMNITKEMGPMPPAWTVYFGAGVVGTAAKKVESLGGKVLVPPANIPEVGRFAVVQDPQGAVFSLFKPAKMG